ncbi:hypothetical protein PJN13_28890, partial [Mycobacterium kansasii]
QIKSHGELDPADDQTWASDNSEISHDLRRRIDDNRAVRRLLLGLRRVDGRGEEIRLITPGQIVDTPIPCGVSSARTQSPSIFTAHFVI